MIGRPVLIRRVVDAVLAIWLVVPPIVLAGRVLLGTMSAGDALDLTGFLVAPWAVVLLNLAIFRAVLGPARRMRRRR